MTVSSVYLLLFLLLLLIVVEYSDSGSSDRLATQVQYSMKHSKATKKEASLKRSSRPA